MRHPRARAETAWILDPLDHPLRRGLGGYALERRTGLRQVLVALDEMAAVAAHLLEQPLAALDDRRPLLAGHRLVTGHALGLHLILDVEKRVFPERHLAVRLLDRVDRSALAAVARRAAELLRVVVADVVLAIGVGLERVLLVLEPLAVDGDVAVHAPLDAPDPILEVVALEVGEEHLLHGRHHRKASAQDVERDAVELQRQVLDPGVVRAELLGELSHLALLRRDRVHDLGLGGLGCLVRDVRGVLLGKQRLESSVLLGAALSGVLRMLELVPRLLDLALHHAQIEVGLRDLDLGVDEIVTEVIESRSLGPRARERGRRLGVLLLERDVLLDPRESLALGGDLALVFRDGETVKVRLVHLPEVARERVLPDRPHGAGEQQPDSEQEYGRVRSLFFALEQVGHRHSPESASTRRVSAPPTSCPRRTRERPTSPSPIPSSSPTLE